MISCYATVPAALLCLLVSARSAGAQDAGQGIKRTGFELGARIGYSAPFADAQKSVELSREIAWQIPVELDLGYRESERVTYGLYFGYGFGKPGSSAYPFCDADGISCSAHTLRAGVQVLFHIAPRKPIGGWVSVGVGVEQLRIGIQADMADVHYSGAYLGFEAPSVQLGLDFRTRSGLALGPFLGLLPGMYLDLDGQCTGRGCVNVPGVSIGEKALHLWFVFGVRGALLL